MFHNYPYTDFHEANMDWFLDQFKSLLQEWSEMQVEFANLQEAFEALRTYVNEYFDNLDVQQEINNKLDAMARSGELTALMLPFIQSETAEWLAGHITQETGYVLDTSLTITGAAADAAAVGAALKMRHQHVNPNNYSLRLPSMRDALVNGEYNMIYSIESGVTSEMITDFPADYTADASSFVVYPTRGTDGDYSIGLLYSRNGKLWRAFINAGNIVWENVDARFHVYPDTILSTNYSDIIPTIAGYETEYATMFRLGSSITNGMITDLPATYVPSATTLIIYPAQSVSGYYTTYVLSAPYTRQFFIGMLQTNGIVWYDTGSINAMGQVSTSTYADLLPSITDYDTKNKVTFFAIHSSITREEIPDLPEDFTPSAYSLIIVPNTGTGNYTTYFLFSSTGIFYMGMKVSGAIRWFRLDNVMADTYTGSISMYHRIGVLGDSYSYGSIYDHDGVHQPRNENLSWIANMARRNGCEYKIFGVGGSTTKSWLTADLGGVLFDNTPDKCGLYFIQFGINDSNPTTGVTLGTTADIGTDADTFYAYYSKIIQKVRNKDPQAFIMLLGCGRRTGRYDAYTDAAEDIAEYYGIPFYNQFNDPYLKYGQYGLEMYGGHPTALGYASLSKAIERCYNVVTRNYREYFMEYPAADWE